MPVEQLRRVLFDEGNWDPLTILHPAAARHDRVHMWVPIGQVARLKLKVPGTALRICEGDHKSASACQAPLFQRRNLWTAETVGSPRFLADLRSHALLNRLRWTHDARPFQHRRCCLPTPGKGRRPQSVISELNTRPTISLSTLHLFGYPRGARLASGWRPPLAGRDSYPQGPFGRFQRLRCHLGLTSSLPPSPGFAWRTPGTDSVSQQPGRSDDSTSHLPECDRASTYGSWHRMGATTSQRRMLSKLSGEILRQCVPSCSD